MAFLSWRLPLWHRPLPQDASHPFEEQLRCLRRKRDVAALIELLRRSDRCHKQAVIEALKEVTGKDLGPKARLWRRWHRSRASAGGKAAWPRYTARVLQAVVALSLIRVLYALGSHLRRNGQSARRAG